MSRVTVKEGIPRIAYTLRELVAPSLGSEIAGFEPAGWQPYPQLRGKRLSAPVVHTPVGFTEVVQASEDLHAIITDWPAGASQAAIWAETVPGQYGYLYIGLEGDGRIEVEGLGQARRSGACCSLTIAPPSSVQVWRTGPGVARRGICIAFHARHLRTRYPDLLERCTGTLAPWLANSEAYLRDFEVPLLPLMQAATMELLSTGLDGSSRHIFVSSTVEQLLCLALAVLADRSSASARLSVRDRRIVHHVRAVIDENLTAPPSVEALAKRLGINRNKLRFAFKATFGTSVDEYLVAQRMRLAFELLEDGRHTISEISATLGYSHTCNFTTAFKRRFGITPRAVRYNPA